jgi:AraC family transcriptional regulator
MIPRIETLPEKKLAGKHLKMSLAQNKTGILWQSFMIRRDEITDSVGTNLYSLQIYDPFYFERFDPAAEFEKWAATEVSSFDNIPVGMGAFTIPEGLYAVFIHVGGPDTGPQTFQYIFETWFPQSGYQLDNRPHFELLGEKYNNHDPRSEEEIWIPIKVKE